MTKRILAICRPQGFLYGAGAAWVSGGSGLPGSLYADGYAENTWLDGPVGSVARLVGVAPFVMFGYIAGQLLALFTSARGLELGAWLIVPAALVLPMGFAGALYVSRMCGPLVVLRDWGLVVGSASEGIHDIPWDRVVRWRRSVGLGIPSHVIDLGESSPLATQRIVVVGGWTFRRA